MQTLLYRPLLYCHYVVVYLEFSEYLQAQETAVVTASRNSSSAAWAFPAGASCFCQNTHEMLNGQL